MQNTIQYNTNEIQCNTINICSALPTMSMTEGVFHKKSLHPVVSVRQMCHKYYWLCRSNYREKLECSVTVRFFSVVHVCVWFCRNYFSSHRMFSCQLMQNWPRVCPKQKLTEDCQSCRDQTLRRCYHSNRKYSSVSALFWHYICGFLVNVNSSSCSLYVVVRPSVCLSSVCLSSVVCL